MRRVDPIGKLVSAAFLALAAASVVMALSPKVGAKRTAVEQKDAVVPVAGVDSWAIGAERYPVLCRVNPTWDTLTIPKGSPVVVRDERDRAWAARVDSCVTPDEYEPSSLHIPVAPVAQADTLVIVRDEGAWAARVDSLLELQSQVLQRHTLMLGVLVPPESVRWIGPPALSDGRMWAADTQRWERIDLGLRADGVVVWKQRP